MVSREASLSLYVTLAIDTGMSRIFVSYRHDQQDWVWKRLVPALEGGGVVAVIDRDTFRAGEGVIGQMDHQQDQADAVCTT